jgi:hypothetical protein
MRRSHFARRAARLAAVVGVVYLVFLVSAFAAMRQPPERFGRIMRHVPAPLMMAVPFEPMWNAARGGTLRVGDLAPDFTLSRVDRKSEVQLSAYRGKQPVALVFGSYT